MQPQRSGVEVDEDQPAVIAHRAAQRGGKGLRILHVVVDVAEQQHVAAVIRQVRFRPRAADLGQVRQPFLRGAHCDRGGGFSRQFRRKDAAVRTDALRQRHAEAPPSGPYLADDLTAADAGEIGERRRLALLPPRQERAERVIQEGGRAHHRHTRTHARRSPHRHATPPGRRDANRRENDVRRG